MSIEALWYSSYASDGTPPKMRRLCRQPMQRQWTAAIDLAIAFAAGEAGYRKTGRITLTGEETWYWRQADGDWWLIPHRVDRRAFALTEAATECELYRGRGQAAQTDVAIRLERWRQTGQWRTIAATIHPRHGKPGKDLSIFAPTPRRRTRRRGVGTQ